MGLNEYVSSYLPERELEKLFGSLEGFKVGMLQGDMMRMPA
jgi:hypothetical protein